MEKAGARSGLEKSAMQYTKATGDGRISCMIMHGMKGTCSLSSTPCSRGILNALEVYPRDQTTFHTEEQSI